MDPSETTEDDGDSQGARASESGDRRRPRKESVDRRRPGNESVDRRRPGNESDSGDRSRPPTEFDSGRTDPGTTGTGERVPPGSGDPAWPLGGDREGVSAEEPAAVLARTGATVGEAPTAIDLRIPGDRRRDGRPVHLGLSSGDWLLTGEFDSPAGPVRGWRITGITPDLVAGRAAGSNAPTVWDRERVEASLASGELGVELSGFTHVTTDPGPEGSATGDLDGSAGDPAGPGTEPPARRADVRVVAHGNDGRTFQCGYREVGEDAGVRAVGTGRHRPVELRWVDGATAGLPPHLRATLDREVATALSRIGHRPVDG